MIQKLTNLMLISPRKNVDLDQAATLHTWYLYIAYANDQQDRWMDQRMDRQTDRQK